MSTIEQIDQLVEIAQQLGYRVRYDYFGGTGGGVCESREANSCLWIWL